MIALLLLTPAAHLVEEEWQGRALGIEIVSAPIKPIAATVVGEGEHGPCFSGEEPARKRGKSTPSTIDSSLPSSLGWTGFDSSFSVYVGAVSKIVASPHSQPPL